MIYDINETTSLSIAIDEDFPPEELIATFQSYLKYYYRSIHSLSSSVREKNRMYIQAMFTRFVKFNPIYGRKILKKTSGFSQNITYKPTFEQNSPGFEPPFNYSKLYTEGHKKETNVLSNFVLEYRKKANSSYRTIIQGSTSTPIMLNFNQLSQLVRAAHEIDETNDIDSDDDESEDTDSVS